VIAAPAAGSWIKMMESAGSKLPAAAPICRALAPGAVSDMALKEA